MQQFEARGCRGEHKKSAQIRPDPFNETGPKCLRKPNHIEALLAAEPTMISPVVVSTLGTQPSSVHPPPVRLWRYT